MREIKFRGKSYKTGEWLYGDLVQLLKGVMAILPEFICRVVNRRARIINPAVYEVDVESVGQYTGLKDKNGKEIYEGEIIEVKGRYRRVVVWDKIGYALMPCEDYHDKTFWVMSLQHPGEDWWDTFNDEIEAIGNIHDNPDLI